MDYKSFITNIYDRLGKGDMAPFIDGLHEHVVWSHNAEAGVFKFSGTHRGKDAGIKCLSEMNGEFPPESFRAIEMTGEGDRLCVHCEIVRRTAGAEGIRTQSAHFFRFEDGKIISFLEIFDTAQALRQMGRLTFAPNGVAEAAPYAKA